MKNFTVERNGLVYLFIESTTARLVLQTTYYDLSTLKNSDYAALRCSLARYKDHRPFSIVVYINTCCIHTICRPPPARYYNETNSYCCNSFHTNTIGSGSDFNPQLDLLWIRIRLGVHLKTNSMLIITSHILFAVTPQAHSLLSTDKAKQMKQLENRW